MTARSTSPASKTPASSRDMRDFRIALFSGNYNCVRDGSNQALNRLVAHVQSRGATVRIYSPTIKSPAFEPEGTLVSVPSMCLPFRGEYRLAAPIGGRIRRDLEAFRPNLVHISAPDILGCSAVKWAERANVPVVASLHTRFETYFRYYGLAWVEEWVRRYQFWLYNRCQQVYVPSKCMADILRSEGLKCDIRFWGRGVNHQQFNPARRSMEWRRAHGFKDDEIVISFVGRIVREKGLQPFANAIRLLRERTDKARVLAVGDGPAREWFTEQVPGIVCTGSLSGDELATAFASSDIFLNPSITETFGNVNLEAIASGVAVVGAKASGSNSVIDNGVTGLLVEPDDGANYCDALETLIKDPERLRRMGEAGHVASQDYKWPRILDEVASHYIEAVQRYRPKAVYEPPSQSAFARFTNRFSDSSK